jgi:hypothetical protein
VRTHCCWLLMLTNCCSNCMYLQAVRSRFQLHKSITPDYYGFSNILLLLVACCWC